jgi:hypothetical protein
MPACDARLAQDLEVGRGGSRTCLRHAPGTFSKTTTSCSGSACGSALMSTVDDAEDRGGARCRRRREHTAVTATPGCAGGWAAVRASPRSRSSAPAAPSSSPANRVHRAGGGHRIASGEDVSLLVAERRGHVIPEIAAEVGGKLQQEPEDG